MTDVISRCVDCYARNQPRADTWLCPVCRTMWHGSVQFGGAWLWEPEEVYAERMEIEQALAESDALAAETLGEN